MKRMAMEFMKLSLVLGAGSLLSGFTAGGCGGGFEVSRCETLSETACLADPVCAPEFAATNCACALCAPDQANCPPCDCAQQGGFAGCHLRPTPPPAQCFGLGEPACLQHPECRPVYAGEAIDGGGVPIDDVNETVDAGSPETGDADAGSGTATAHQGGCLPPPPPQGFLSCEPAQPVCPMLNCAEDCANPHQYDSNGCETCACAERRCTTDSDCASDERCQVWATQPAQADCGKDGTRCPTPAPGGVCIPVKRPSCKADAECGAGQRCETRCGNGWCDSACVAAACSTDQDCGAGTTCQADPSDPCNRPNVDCAAVRSICLPPHPTMNCATLDEKSCSSSGCRAVYGAAACPPGAACTGEMVFKRCE